MLIAANQSMADTYKYTGEYFFLFSDTIPLDRYILATQLLLQRIRFGLMKKLREEQSVQFHL